MLDDVEVGGVLEAVIPAEETEKRMDGTDVKGG